MIFPRKYQLRRPSVFAFAGFEMKWLHSYVQLLQSNFLQQVTDAEDISFVTQEGNDLIFGCF
jgi:hypothetical protein